MNPDLPPVRVRPALPALSDAQVDEAYRLLHGHMPDRSCPSWLVLRRAFPEAVAA